MAKTVYSVIPKKMYGVIPKAAYGVDLLAYAELTVYITAYYVSSWTQAIQDACAALKTLGGGTILFPAGDYLIKPSLINISGSSITLKGLGTARLYTTETALWNCCIMVTGNDVVFDTLTFDHRGDSALLPTVKPYKGAISIWYNGSDYSSTANCIFYSYGIVTVLCDNYGSTAPLQYDHYNNYIYWQRKVDTWYDVSCVHLETRVLHYYNNVTTCVETAFTTWMARTGAELHFAKGYATGNTFTASQVGILYIPWAAYSNDYDPTYGADVLLNLNVMVKVIRGFEIWVSTGSNGRDIKNVTIEYNTIGLYLSANAYAKPANAVYFYHVGSYTAEVYDVEIHHNVTTETRDTAVYPTYTSVKNAFYWLVTGADTGAYCLNLANTMRRISIHDETVIGYHYSMLNLYRRSNVGGTLVHYDISFINNAATNCSFAIPYQDLFKAFFNLGASDLVTVTGNAISNPGIALQDQEEQLAYLTNLTYTGNTFT